MILLRYNKIYQLLDNMPDIADNLPGILGLELFGQPLWQINTEGGFKNTTKDINCRVNVIDPAKLQYTRQVNIPGRANIALKQVI